VSFYQPVGEYPGGNAGYRMVVSKGNKLNHFLEVLEC
jgi:hypothetical protein